MPSSINGIGTHYYGKANVDRRHDACERCGKTGELLSYDTGLYFCFLFVPLIPLGRKRVFDQCSSCTTHRVTKLAEWQELRASALREATALVSAMPLVPADAAKGLGQLVGIGAREEFLAAAERLRARAARDADLLLGCAVGYTRFGLPDLAVDCYRDALAIKDDVDVRRALAVALMRAGRPGDARPHLEKLLEAGEAGSDRVGVFYLQVEALQAKGLHEDALALIASLIDRNPALATDKELLKLRATSVKHKQTNKPIVSKTIRGLTAVPARAGGGPGLARLVWPLALAAAPLAYFGTAYWRGTHRTVHLVNGLDRPYTATVAGLQHALEPGARVEVVVPEGAHTVHHAPFPGSEVVGEFTLATSFWSRPFADPIWVLNPDRTALLLLESSVYQKTPDPADSGTSEVRFGRLLHEFDDIDYPFAEFPESITTKASSGRFVKWRVDALRVGVAAQAHAILSRVVGPEQATAWARLRLTETPDDALLPLILASSMKDDEFLALSAPFLDREPLLIEWHRAYQYVKDRAGAEAELVSDYDQRLAAKPDDADLLYLRGRLAIDPGEAESYYRRAIDHAPPSPHALHAMAYQKLSQGDFEPGIGYATHALELMPENMTFADTLRQLRMGHGDLDLLLERARSERGPEEVTLLYARGDRAGGDAALAKYLGRTKRESSPEQQEELKQAMTVSGLYLLGDRDAFVTAAGAEDGGAGYGFEAAVTAGKVAEAASLLAGEGGDDVEKQLALYLLAERAGDRGVASASFTAALTLLRAEGADERLAADALSRARPVSARELCALVLPASLKRLVVTAAGVRDPGDRATYFSLARRLNFERWFPHLLIRDIVGE